MQQILIDGRNSANILFLKTFKKLWLNESQIQKSSSPLTGFEGTKVTPIGMVTLTVQAAAKSLKVEFIVIDIKFTYNAIMGKEGSTRWKE